MKENIKNSHSEKSFVLIEDIEFVDTPTMIAQEAIAEFNRQQAVLVNEADSSLIALSKIGNQVVGHEVWIGC